MKWLTNSDLYYCKLKKGHGGRTRDATMKPVNDPDKLPRTTFIGINHLQWDSILVKKINLCGALVSYMKKRAI